MARSASRKVSAHRACVSKQAKRLHKTATRTRSHQTALARANKACAKKTTKKSVRGSSGSTRAYPKRVLGSGVCTSRTIRVCSQDPSCKVTRRPKGGRTCSMKRQAPRSQSSSVSQPRSASGSVPAPRSQNVSVSQPRSASGSAQA